MSDDLRAALANLKADPFLVDGDDETPDDVFATDRTPKPLSPTELRERDVARKVARGFVRRNQKDDK